MNYIVLLVLTFLLTITLSSL